MTDPGSWNAIIADLPGSHVLQTWEWGQVKAQYGWQPLPQTWRDKQDRIAAAALVLQRTIPVKGLAARLRVLYVPKGPLLDWNDVPLRTRVLDDLRTLAQKQGAILIKIDPDVIVGTGVPGQPDAHDDLLGKAVVANLQARGWRFSTEQVQFRNTVSVALTPGEDELLANMKQKTRYNIRLAVRKGVVVRPGDAADIPLLFRMYAETSIRDGFVIRDEGYYATVWATFMQAGLAEPLIAEVEGQPVAGVIIFRFAERAWYLYGMSRDLHRERMPGYLLQWEAMRRAKAAGCLAYDLWGAPDVFDESDSMWGVYRFKEGLGGRVVRHMGAWDLPLNPLLYRLYTHTLPRLLDLMRRRGRARTRALAVE